MDTQFKEQFHSLIQKYTELLIGDSSPELEEKVKMWALYTYISKSMPPLVKHWNDLYPGSKEEMKQIILEIKKLNDEYRKQK